MYFELYIISSLLTGHQFSLTYEHISLHAVSRDRSTFPNSEHLYLMIDKKLTDSEGMPTPTSTPESSDIDDDSESDGDASDMTEIRFVPENKACLQDLFKHMSDCQALHPDPENDEEDEMGEQGDDEDGDEQEEVCFCIIVQFYAVAQIILYVRFFWCNLG